MERLNGTAPIQPSGTPVLIIGAGIAGPALAIQLAKIGIRSEIVEARKESEMAQGVFLGITPNGLNVLNKLIDRQTLKEEYTGGKMNFYNSRNKPIAVLDTRYQLERYGAETIQVKRAKVSEELRKAAHSHSIPVHYRKRIISLTEIEAGVTVQFEDGSERRADFVIACDGVHSICRKLLFPQQPLPVYTQQLSTAGYANCPQIEGTDGIKMIFGKRSFFAYAVSNKGEIWWFNNFFREAEPDRDAMGELSREIKSALLHMHRADPPEISAIISATNEIFAYPIHEYPSLAKWHSKRCCLLGDAAHATAPHIGQGASLALEDSAVLTRCFDRLGLNDQAFVAFQQCRQHRVEKLIKTARKIGNKKAGPSKFEAFFRDVFLSFFIKAEIRKMDWVYRYNVTLNNYTGCQEFG